MFNREIENTEDLKKEPIVRKSHELLRTQKPDWSVWQNRVFTYICSDAPKRVTKGDALCKFEFNIADLIHTQEFKVKGAKGREYIASAVRKMQDLKIGWWKDGAFESFVIFPYVKVDTKNLQIIVHVPNRVIDHFLWINENRGYNSYRKIEFDRLQSCYSQQLFEFALSWVNQETHSGIPHTVEFLYKLFDVADVASYENNFYAFERRVLAPSVAEINKNTNLNITYKLIREGRKTVAVRFSIYERTKLLESSDEDTVNDDIETMLGNLSKNCVEDIPDIEVSPIPEPMPVKKVQLDEDVALIEESPKQMSYNEEKSNMKESIMDNKIKKNIADLEKGLQENAELRSKTTDPALIQRYDSLEQRYKDLIAEMQKSLDNVPADIEETKQDDDFSFPSYYPNANEAEQDNTPF